MFKKEFQGGTYVEVFSAQGKDPVAQWKLTGSSNIRKEFDRNVKSFVYILDGAAATTKMQLPKDNKNTLALTQRYLVLQILVAKGQDVSIDLGVHDLNHGKRRLFFSTAHKETQTTPLHNKIPLNYIKRDVWLNLVIDMKALVSETWRGQMYGSIDSVCLSANCRLRRIFTMRSQPLDTTDDEELYGFTGTNSGELEPIPKQCQLAPDIPQFTQVVNVTKIQHYEGKGRSAESTTKPQTGSSSEDLNSSGNRKSMNADGYHIAFGTKITGQRKLHKEATSRIKSQHHRSKSDADTTQHSTKLPSSSRVGSADSKQTTKRERKNSDPGATNSDPEIAVDKASLRTSRTWTDGADNGKENIPFVRPHPPTGPSSDRVRRKPRVKSAGKERTPHTGFTDDRDVKSQPSSRHNSLSGSASKREEKSSAQPKMIANDDEVADIMAAMQESVRRSWQKTSESESEPLSSHNTSEAHEADDSISEVIDVLRGTTLSDGKSTVAPKEYEDTDDEDVEEIEDKIYMFSSPPKSAPRHMTNNYVGSSISGSISDKQVKQNVTKSHKHTRKKSSQATDKTSGSHLTSSQRDFWRDPAASSDEETSLRSRLNKHDISPRTSPNMRGVGPDGLPEFGANIMDNGKYPYPHAVNPNGLLLQVPAGYGGPLPGGNRNQACQGGASGMNLPHTGAGHTPVSSQPRQSISRKSLREIPPDDVRLSQTQKPYNVAKYQMEDLSESFETKMLQELKEQALQGSIDESEDEKPRPTPRTLAAQKEKHKREKDLMNYTDSCSDSDDDHTPMSTYRSHNYANKAHNYQDEMKMASARLNQNDFLSQSNPRDWGKIYSPPIVLTSDMNGSMSSHSQLSPGNLQQLSPNSNAQLSPGQKDLNSPHENTDDEEELDLLFDPVLNCYFDPKTQKYYELRF